MADALAVIDAGGKQFAEPPALDMDALMLSVTLADGSNWSVLGGEYPASTTALGQDATLSFAHLPLSQVLQKLVKNRPVAVAAAAVPAVRPKVPASPLELDMDKVRKKEDKTCVSVKECNMAHLSSRHWRAGTGT